MKYLPSLNTFISLVVVIVLDQVIGVSAFILAQVSRMAPGVFPIVKA